PEGSVMPQSALGFGRGRGGFGGGGGRGRGGAPAPAANDPCAGTGRGRTPANPAWQPNIGGCESGFTLPVPDDPDVVFASCYGNKVTRWDARTGTARSIEPWMVSLDSAPNEAKYRC